MGKETNPERVVREIQRRTRRRFNNAPPHMKHQPFSHGLTLRFSPAPRSCGAGDAKGEVPSACDDFRNPCNPSRPPYLPRLAARLSSSSSNSFMRAANDVFASAVRAHRIAASVTAPSNSDVKASTRRD